MAGSGCAPLSARTVKKEKKMSKEFVPQVGLSLLVVRNDHVLLGRRKGSEGAGEGAYGTPGGHLEYAEQPSEGVLRELVEECGPNFKVSPPTFLCAVNVLEYTPKHYVELAFVAHWASGEPENMEPHKLIGWEWHPLSRLPDGRFASIDSMIISHQTGQRYFEDV